MKTFNRKYKIPVLPIVLYILFVMITVVPLTTITGLYVSGVENEEIILKTLFVVEFIFLVIGVLKIRDDFIKHKQIRDNVWQLCDLCVRTEYQGYTEKTMKLGYRNTIFDIDVYSKDKYWISVTLPNLTQHEMSILYSALKQAYDSKLHREKELAFSLGEEKLNELTKHS